MASRRSSTVYDYAALRVHPDGSRMRIPAHTSSDPRAPSSSTPFSAPSRRAFAVQTLRGQWIARDAGGSSKVPVLTGRRKNAARKAKEAGGGAPAEGQDAEIGVEDDIARGMAVDEVARFSDEDDGSYEEGRNTKKRGRKGKRAPDLRPKKRAKFNADLGYLSPPPQPSIPPGMVRPSADIEASQEGPSRNNMSQLPEPSPDLLKALHRFASEFYSEHGQLLNISREYRRERKLRSQERALRKKGKEKAKAKSSPPGTEGRDGGESSEDEDNEDEEIEEEDDEDEDEGGEEGEEGNEGDGEDDENEDEDGQKPRTKPKKSSKAKGKRKPKGGKPRILPPVYSDMYRVFEGSALMVLGMLVQEHVVSLLTPHKPPGWDEEVRLAYAEHPEIGEDDFVENENDEEEEEEGPVDEDDGGEEEEQSSGASPVPLDKQQWEDSEEDSSSEDDNFEGEEDSREQRTQVEPENDNDDEDEYEDDDDDEEENSFSFASKDKRSPQTEKPLAIEEDSSESSEDSDVSDSEEDSDEQPETSEKAGPSSFVLQKNSKSDEKEAETDSDDENETDEEGKDKAITNQRLQQDTSPFVWQKNSHLNADEEETDSEDEDETEEEDEDDAITDRRRQQDTLQNNETQKAVVPPRPMENSDFTEEEEEEEDVVMRSDDTEHSDSEEEYI